MGLAKHDILQKEGLIGEISSVNIKGTLDRNIFGVESPAQTTGGQIRCAHAKEKSEHLGGTESIPKGT